jgi:predicted transcriptional regulator
LSGPVSNSYIAQNDKFFGRFCDVCKKRMSLPFVEDPSKVSFVEGRMKLSEKEKRVYNVLLRLTGPVKVTRIAEWADLPRSTAHYILKKFVHAKIAHTKLCGKRHVYYFNKITNSVSGIPKKRELLK